MAKKFSAKPSATPVAPTPVQNAVQMLAPIANGLSDAIMGFTPNNFGAQISQVETIFVNLRWYLISNMRQPLTEAYVELGLVKTIVDVPVDDAFRGGVECKSKILSPEEIEELQFTLEQEDDLGAASQSKKWERLYGGAGILIITDQPMDTPLEIESIQPGEPLAFHAVDMWELYWDQQNIDGDGTPIDNPDFKYYRYYGKNVHKSRVLPLRGLKAPSFIRPRLRGWGLSVVETLIRSINQYLKANDLTFEVLDEFKIDVYKIKNLTGTLLSPDGTNIVKNRIQLANYQKNFQNAITMDSEDDYLQKELTFAGLAETMQQIRMQVASDMRMPLTKLFGISAAGFSSGEDDIENYNSMVESTIRTPIKHHIIKMVKLRCQQLFGYVPDDLTVSFKPLRILSSEQEENVKTQKFNRNLAAAQAGLMSPKEFKDACNKDQLLSISLDTSLDTLTAEDDDTAETEDDAPDAPAVTAPKTKLKAKEAKA
jgi:phage-related protein (TIGR01555 family)